MPFVRLFTVCARVCVCHHHHITPCVRATHTLTHARTHTHTSAGDTARHGRIGLNHGAPSAKRESEPSSSRRVHTYSSGCRLAAQKGPMLNIMYTTYRYARSIGSAVRTGCDTRVPIQGAVINDIYVILLTWIICAIAFQFIKLIVMFSFIFSLTIW